MKSFQIIDSAARLLNKNLIPQRASVTFFYHQFLQQEFLQTYDETQQ